MLIQASTVMSPLNCDPEIAGILKKPLFHNPACISPWLRRICRSGRPGLATVNTPAGEDWAVAAAIRTKMVVLSVPLTGTTDSGAD